MQCSNKAPPIPCTTPPLICSSTSCGLITVPQSSTHQCLIRVTKPDSTSTSGKLAERKPLGPAVAIDHDAVDDVEVVRRRLQDAGRAGEHVGAQRLAGLPGGFAADAGGARRPGAAAVGRVVGVAG